MNNKKLTAGERLRSLRGSRSQEEVAEALGISQSALSTYENDERIPRDRIKVKIADFYKRSVQFIFFN
jgi:transcriptional regulator with XRE-family HTH domain